MAQNSQRLSWTFYKVDAKLHQIMINIHKNAKAAAKEYGMLGNLANGANIAAFYYAVFLFLYMLTRCSPPGIKKI
jgi:glutamate dehydrogenase (NADP+)